MFKLLPVYLLIFFDVLGFGLLIPVVRGLTMYLHENTPELKNTSPEVLSGVLMGSYSLFQFIFSPILGGLSDRFGRKPLLALSIAGNVFSYALWIISNQYWTFLISRIASGATGGNISIAQALLVDMSKQEDRGKVMGGVGAVFGLGFILGPLLGGLLSSYTAAGEVFSIKINPYGSIGAFAMFFSLLNLAWLFFVVQDSPRSRRPSWRKNIWRIDLKMSSNLGCLNLVSLLVHVAFVAMESTLAWLLLQRYSLDDEETGYFFGLMGIAMVLVQGFLLRKVLEFFSSKQLLSTGLFLGSSALFLISIDFNLFIFVSIVIILSVGFGFTNPSISTLGSLYSLPEERGASLGALQAINSMARFIAPLIATYVYANFSPKVLYIGSGLLVICALFFSRKLQDLELAKKRNH